MTGTESVAKPNRKRDTEPTSGGGWGVGLVWPGGAVLMIVVLAGFVGTAASNFYSSSSKRIEIGDRHGIGS